MSSLRNAVKAILVAGSLLAANTTLASDVTSDRQQASLRPGATDRRASTPAQVQPNPTPSNARPCICKAAPRAQQPSSSTRDAELDQLGSQGG